MVGRKVFLKADTGQKLAHLENSSAPATASPPNSPAAWRTDAGIAPRAGSRARRSQSLRPPLTATARPLLTPEEPRRSSTQSWCEHTASRDTTASELRAQPPPDDTNARRPQPSGPRASHLHRPAETAFMSRDICSDDREPSGSPASPSRAPGGDSDAPDTALSPAPHVRRPQ